MIYFFSHQKNCIAALAGHSSWVLSVAFSPNTTNFATGYVDSNQNPTSINSITHRSSDKKVKVWDIHTRQCVHTFEEHADQVWGVAYNEDGDKLASVGDDRCLNIYSV